ncbi:MAG: polysaccharide deacetylase family protein [Gammaproteobacteria bacterium]|uniref:polysaccharide deacetylase family protein n=1 Tax=Rhodoferax sp. TaxID=50421 RepID=UPI001D3E862C|nr:polysaccharide deacetylase family protein [Rhodoferax sp.]MBU3898651.1 polysaccharide deacetylase family protein [Gammaproteobacteria bacterium]MBU3997754.1 polysaccharide deacetylase family protein [Gammaproteobacteria bacterium]MBU4019560.1 polysaccharide deacetylase family protein [Gammaproteobacteria bacterium]MBU4079074.1 polysaccharide deacetylase family protein [Gammaproteobacteria bacterium]MBU4171924.1 polysaccharide deacetylase family protein [Gammaproteobacteria bacterium]
MTSASRSRSTAHSRPIARFFVACLLSLPVWTGVPSVAMAAMAAPPQPLEPVYLYSSPITAAFFSANGTSYDALKTRWREYLRTFYGKAYREVSRANLLAGLQPGVLVLGSAVLLDDQERKAINAFADAGGSILATWGTGARDGRGKWAGYGFIEALLQMKVVGTIAHEDNLGFLNTFGDHPLTWTVPGGERIFLGEIAETPLRVDSPNLAARYFDWQRFPAKKDSNGAIAYLEKDNSRRAYLGFSESSWEYDERLELPKIADSIIAWLRHQPAIYKAAWPDGKLSAQLLEMDTEDKFANALNFAKELEAANIRGTFYALTGIALKHRDTVEKLAEKHEIGYHAEIHVGFKGKPAQAQQERLGTMVSEMREIVGTRALPTITGFRAPTESWDQTTEKLLRKIGIRHHVTGPTASESRVPSFSRSEPALSTEDAIVILPRTQMDDLNYQGLKLSFEKASELLSLDFDYLHEAGALGVLSVHSQNYAPEGLMAKLTPPYIKRLQEHRGDTWAASGEEIAAWWRARERVVFDPFNRSGSEFSFDVRAPGNVKGLTFFVTHPAMNAAPKSVKATQPGSPQPTLVRVDAYRSALIFKEMLQAGHYAYSLEF